VNPEIETIRAIVAHADARQSDAEGFAQLLTEDVALVNFGGRRVLGRDGVREAMRAALATPLAQVLTRNELVDVRFPRPGVAVASCIKHISDEREERDAPLAARGATTFVLVEEQGGWRIALVQTTPIAAPD
jgi:uncharacterized protein (TIGR02246 family)